MKKLFWMIAPALILAACGSSPATNQPATDPALLSTGEPDPASQTFSASDGVIASAEAQPAQISEISFPFSGTVKEINIKEGDAVLSGNVLMSLYAPDLELSVTSAELAAKAAELEYSYWIPHRFDRPPERAQQAKAEWDQTLRALDTARASFEQTSLNAPYDGTVLDVLIQTGEYAQTAQTVLVFADTAHMQIVTTDLSERDIPLVKIGQKAEVYIEALDVTISGRVLRISPSANIVGGDVVYPVVIELDEQPQGLRFGMTAEARIETK